MANAATNLQDDFDMNDDDDEEEDYFDENKDEADF